jgi:bifunctional non-homologous end joining protein LigD
MESKTAGKRRGKGNGSKRKPPSRKLKGSKPSSHETSESIKADGHTVKLTNQNKFYWPEEKITKGRLLEYYNTISKYILPHLKDRPQSLKRNPNGIVDKGFYHKDAGDAAPKWVKSVELYSDSATKFIDYIICNNKATLLYLNNLGCIEINPWNSRIKTLDFPDYLIMDIDPSEENSFEEVIETALVIKEILDKAKLKSYCKTSGASGLHVYIPLHAIYEYDKVRSFAELIALLTQEQLPTTTTVERSLKKRQNRIYIDYLQNKRGQTLASVYSVRPVPLATVSTPLLWKEVRSGLHPSQFTIFNLPARVEKMGDLFAGVIKEKVNLVHALKNLKA